MVKTNNIIFSVCLVFLLIFFGVIFQSFTQRLNLLEKEKYFPDEKKFDEKDNFSFEFQKESSEEEIGKYPPCHSFGNIRWFHDISSGECYEVGTIGPCGKSMTFYQHPNKQLSNFGFCDCDDVVEVKSKVPECEGVERPLVYFPKQDRCYTVFSQGPCEKDEWLVIKLINESSTPICEKNPCIHKGNNKDIAEDEFSLEFWIFYQQKCYKTLTRGYCDKGKILKVSKSNWMPECQRDLIRVCPISLSVSIPALQCRPGNKIHQLGMCKV